MLPVDAGGRVDLDHLRACLDETTALVSLMRANNETGVLQPVAEAAALARASGALLHCDAVQAAGKVALDVGELGCDLLSLSAHKIYGPQGVGALYVRRGTPMQSLVRGGSQERNRRAGTENVAGIVGFGRAAEIARAELAREQARLGALRERLQGLLLAIPGARVNGAEPRVPNTTNVSFEGADAFGVLMALDLAGIAVSTGAACAAGAAEPSHVLLAMGLPEALVQSSLRFSLGGAPPRRGGSCGGRGARPSRQRGRRVARRRGELTGRRAPIAARRARHDVDRPPLSTWTGVHVPTVPDPLRAMPSLEAGRGPPEPGTVLLLGAGLAAWARLAPSPQ